MNESTVTGAFGTLRMEQDLIPIDTNLPQPDKNWRHTDSHDHDHSWQEGPDHYPTLEWIVDDTWWCTDCEDDHQDGHWACRLCGEEVTPGQRPPPTWRQYLPGQKSYYLNDEPISETEAKQIIAAQEGS